MIYWLKNKALVAQLSKLTFVLPAGLRYRNGSSLTHTRVGSWVANNCFMNEGIQGYESALKMMELYRRTGSNSTDLRDFWNGPRTVTWGDVGTYSSWYRENIYRAWELSEWGINTYMASSIKAVEDVLLIVDNGEINVLKSDGRYMDGSYSGEEVKFYGYNPSVPDRRVLQRFESARVEKFGPGLRTV